MSIFITENIKICQQISGFKPDVYTQVLEFYARGNISTARQEIEEKEISEKDTK